MTDSFRTIRSLSTGVYREKGSRFLAFAFPVESEEEAKSILQGYRKKYHDARHHCYAYRLQGGEVLVRSSDDGEPSGTAGMPILRQIEAFDLCQVMVVVVRYFGGTLLGTGGLIRAYKTAAREALQQAKTVIRYRETVLLLRFSSQELGKVMKIVGEENLKINRQHYSDHHILELSLRLRDKEKVLKRLGKVSGLKIEEADTELAED